MSFDRIVIVDMGCGMIKAGNSKENCHVFPNIYGRFKDPHILYGFNWNGGNALIGDKVQEMLDYLNIRYPMKNGKVENWGLMEKVWNYTFYDKIGCSPEEQPLFLTESPNVGKKQRQRTSETHFERQNIPYLHICTCPAILPMYLTGNTTCTVLDSGDGVTHSICIVDGKPIPESLEVMEVGGRNVTEFLHLQAEERSYEIRDSFGSEYFRMIKEKICFISLDYLKERKKAETSFHCEMEYTLPDSSNICLCDQRFRAPEIMFHPEYFDLKGKGVHKMIHNSITSSCILNAQKHHEPENLYSELHQKIILSGGSTLFENFQERLGNELLALSSSEKLHMEDKKSKEVGKVEKVDFLELSGGGEEEKSIKRCEMIWKGASVVCGLEDVRKSQKWVSKEEYFESGEQIIHKKFMFV